jgi:hypothetical protein
MRTIRYERIEFHGDIEVVENNLLCFIYDIPYIGACGIFPPLHICNEIFSKGGGTGGMGPGATWEPFIITEEEYNELKKKIITTPLELIKNTARYCEVQFEFDVDFDNIRDMSKWLRMVCNKHCESYRCKLDNKGYKGE